MAYVQDIKEDITIAQFIDQYDCQRLWLCPKLVRTGKIDRHPVLQGIECSKWAVPEEIKNCKVTRHWREGKVDCIIWENKDIEDKLMSDYRNSMHPME